MKENEKIHDSSKFWYEDYCRPIWPYVQHALVISIEILWRGIMSFQHNLQAFISAQEQDGREQASGRV